ncbi:protein phosphatase 2C domain-containing protein [Streptomyces sp. NPDC006739]|uniref:protein phosphatase 2C domain-containing protein n=1 Tax=Streptomyces sp. NPDC006739 TaxID=3364763 RepID=UPI00368D4E71
MFHNRRSEDDRGEQRREPPHPPAPAPALYRGQEHGAGYPAQDPAPAEGGPAPVYDWQRDGAWPPGGPTARPPAPAPAPAPAPERQSAPRHAGAPGTVAAEWRPIHLGTAAPEFDTKPPARVLSYRPDTVCDGWSTPALDVRLASVRGYAHRAEGRPREDDVAAAWEETTGAVVFAVADGVSDAGQPHIGSQLACRSAIDELLRQVRAGDGFVTDWPTLLGTVHWQLRAQAARLLKRRDGQDASVEETADLLATTLVAGAATPTRDGVRVALVSVGDSGAWAIKYQELYPLKGGKTLGADGLVSSAVQPLPYVPADIEPFHFHLDPASVLLLGTDGFGDPVGDGRGMVARLFAEELGGPPPPLAFAYLLDFYRETFDDDRSLIALWPRAGAPGGQR